MRTRRVLGTALAALGALLLLDVALTLAWREPVTWLLDRGGQPRLERRLATLDARFGATMARDLPARLSAGARMDAAAHALARRSRPGDPLGRLSIPAIGVRFVVVQGTGSGDLRFGPGHYQATALPGEQGVFGLAGHRTTHLQPFRSIDALRPGDRIVMTMPYGRFIYRVEGTRIVAPSDVAVLTRTGSGQRIVLTACHPLFSAAQRIVVSGRLVRASALGPAAVRPA
jgi:sortase A